MIFGGESGALPFPRISIPSSIASNFFFGEKGNLEVVDRGTEDCWSDAIARPLISSLFLPFVYSRFSRSSLLVPKLFPAGEKLKLARLPSTDDIEAPFQVSLAEALWLSERQPR